MVLAAGRGERMGTLTARTPKPLLAVGGRPLIEHHLDRLGRLGVERAVVNVCHGARQIRAALGDGRRWGLEIVFSEEPAPALETGGGIVRALPLLGREPFLLINADVLTDFDLGRLLGLAASTLVLVPNPAHHADGDFGLTSAGLLTDAPPRLTYGGIARLDATLFDGLAQGRRRLRPILDRAIADRRLHGLVHRGLWLDVGTPQRLEEARRVIDGGPPLPG